MSEAAKQRELIGTLLREESTLALATTDEQGEACVAPLFYIVDEGLSLYWLSSESSMHSENLKRVPRAAGTVYRHTHNWRDIRGVQMRGTVTTITEQQRRNTLLTAYRERFQLGTILRLAISQSTLYWLRPDYFRYIDNSRAFGYKFEIRFESE